MCNDHAHPLTFESMLSDPLVRMVMDADRVTVADLVSVMHVARDAVAARQRPPMLRVVAGSAALGARA
jgi:hypothetical protein